MTGVISIHAVEHDGRARSRGVLRGRIRVAVRRRVHGHLARRVHILGGARARERWLDGVRGWRGDMLWMGRRSTRSRLARRAWRSRGPWRELGYADRRAMAVDDGMRWTTRAKGRWNALAVAFNFVP